MHTLRASISLCLAGLLFGAVACYREPSLTNDVPSPDALPDGAPDAPPDANPDGACEVSCVDTHTLQPCAATGLVACAYGCDETGGAHCLALDLSNDVGSQLVTGLGELTLTCDETLTFYDTGQITHGAAEIRPAGAGVQNGIGFGEVQGLPVFAFKNVVLENCNIDVSKSDRMAWVAAQQVVIKNGRIDGSGIGQLDAAVAGCAPGGVSAGFGGGGGGGGTAGGAGSGAPGGAGGGICSNAIEPLRPGSPGGSGDSVNAGFGGAGAAGTALQISALGEIALNGVAFRLGGAGGGKGKNGVPAGGGGSGGTLLLESDVVGLVSVQASANGGNGGYANNAGAPGVDGVGPSTSLGGEGRGGTASNAPGSGTFTNATHTGGGGAVGFIRVLALDLTQTGVVTSPAASLGQPTLR